ncbi:MAG: hypothetical protein AAF108_08515 [Planctomycetota bacterium]
MPGHAAPFEYLAHAFFEGRHRPLIDPRTDQPIVDCVVWANRGGGKTFLGAVATALDLIYRPGIEVRILGGSLEQSRRMQAHLRALFESDALSAELDRKPTADRLVLTNGSRVELLAQSATSVRGTRVQRLRCDEAELFKPDIWEAAQLTTRSTPVAQGSIEALSTMHAPYGLMRELVSTAQPGPGPGEETITARPGVVRRLFKWGVADVIDRSDPAFNCLNDEDGSCVIWPDCPCKSLGRDPARDAGHVSLSDALRMKGRVDQRTWESEMLCLTPTRAHCVYPGFSRDRHVCADDPCDRHPGGAARSPGARAAWVAGMDFGFRGETAVLCARLSPGGVLTVTDEFVATETVVSVFAEWAAGHERSRAEGGLAWIGVDPAGASRSGQTGLSDIRVLQKAGLRVRHRRRPIAEGIAMVRARISPASGEPTLVVHERCGRLIEALETYHYNDEDASDDRPVKDGPDHACDALRYLVQNLDGHAEATSDAYL